MDERPATFGLFFHALGLSGSLGHQGLRELKEDELGPLAARSLQMATAEEGREEVLGAPKKVHKI